MPNLIWFHITHSPPILLSLPSSFPDSLCIYELMSKCKLHKLLHIFPRRTENCFQIDANLVNFSNFTRLWEWKIVQIAKWKLVWKSIHSRWFIYYFICELLRNMRKLFQNQIQFYVDQMKIGLKIKNEMLHRNLQGLFASVVTISSWIYLTHININ